ncbi:MAG: phosphopantetheine-binding protein [Herbaspirillum sp.]|jgi:acyl carrier protein|nr:phosphopantetheine-binding protein [Herbaspirillum sp.]
MTTTFEQLRAILAKDYQLAPDAVTLDAPFEALGIDSLGTAELLFNVEDAFKITIPSRPVELVTVGDVVRYIDELIAAQKTTPDLENTAPKSAAQKT